MAIRGCCVHVVRHSRLLCSRLTPLRGRFHLDFFATMLFNLAGVVASVYARIVLHSKTLGFHAVGVPSPRSFVTIVQDVAWFLGRITSLHLRLAAFGKALQVQGWPLPRVTPPLSDGVCVVLLSLLVCCFSVPVTLVTCSAPPSSVRRLTSHLIVGNCDLSVPPTLETWEPAAEPADQHSTVRATGDLGQHPVWSGVSQPDKDAPKIYRSPPPPPSAHLWGLGTSQRPTGSHLVPPVCSCAGEEHREGPGKSPRNAGGQARRCSPPVREFTGP